MSEQEPFLTPELHAHARALGIVCVLWGHLEMFLNIMLRLLLDLKDDKFSEAIIHNITMREKSQIILGLGYLKVPHATWFAALKWTLDRIDNDIRPKRNRFIHDQWTKTEDGSVRKIETKTGLRKRQAFQLEFFTKVETIVPVAEINKLGREISDMTLRVFALTLGIKDDNAILRDKLPELLADSAPLPPDLAE